MTPAVILDTKTVKEVLALFFGIRPEDIIPNKYSFDIKGITLDEANEILKEARLNALHDSE